MGLDGLLADHQPVGYLRIGQTGGEQPQHLGLPGRQRCQPARVAAGGLLGGMVATVAVSAGYAASVRTSQCPAPIAPWAGLAVLAGWAGAALLAGGALLLARDA